ncbi:unnamed protein product [Adineta ricciae]|uniref:ABC transporter domain-containing protein n=1 Tax=Adineta ricciae TaxID=249248 RepID=A0A815TY84_ADIRI|nr:unnamed protein product [Adineta ricciae]
MAIDVERIPLMTSQKTTNSISIQESTLSWLNVFVEVPGSPSRYELSTSTGNILHKNQQSRRSLLYDLSGIARSGQILAVMGATGVGKTTLMNVLSGQYTDNTLTTAGNVYLNGQLTTRPQRQSSNAIGYVEQYEPFIETMTLQEHLIFQPTSSMFDQIDTLCLLVQGGRQAYFGSKENAQEFFTTKCGLVASSLDGFIEQLAAPLNPNDHQSTLAQNVAADQYTKSEDATLLLTDIEYYLQSSAKLALDSIESSRRSSFLRQVKWLLWRSFLADVRDPLRSTFILIRILVPAIVFGLLYFQLPHSVDFTQNVNSLLLYIAGITVFISTFVILSTMPSNIYVCIKETHRGTYGVLAYYVAIVVHDFPTFIIIPFVYGSILYWMSGMDNTWWHYMSFLAVLILVSNTASAFGELIASFSSTVESAVSTAMPLLHTFMIFSGFFLNAAYIHPVFYIVQYLSPFYYGYSTLYVLQWSTNNRNTTSHCYQYYIDDTEQQLSTNMTTMKTCCVHPIDNSEDLNNLSSHVYFNIAMLVSLFIICHISAFVIIWFRAHKDRLKERCLRTKDRK